MTTKPAILYVEDDAMSRSVMEIILQGHMGLTEVAIFENSANFEQRLASLPFAPNIVFLDIHMQPIDGFQMLAILRQHEQFADLPIVALTASVMNEEIARLKEVGFNGVIPKPIDLDHFPKMLEQLIAGQEIWRIVNWH
jgi:CheY-like chemotaxis protein